MRALNTLVSYLVPGKIVREIVFSLKKKEKRCITSDSIQTISGVNPQYRSLVKIISLNMARR